MTPIQPTDRCCCSSVFGGQGGSCQACCGPPIFYAARSLVIFNLLAALFSTLGFAFTFQLHDCCGIPPFAWRVFAVLLGVSTAMVYWVGLHVQLGISATWWNSRLPTWG